MREPDAHPVAGADPRWTAPGSLPVPRMRLVPADRLLLRTGRR